MPVTDVAIEGSTAYPPGTFASVTAGLTGPAVSPDKIQAAHDAIINRYRADGYVYTAVVDSLNHGHLRFSVIEGHIASVKLDGDIGPAGTQVLRFLDHLTTSGPVTTGELERWLLLASDIPGVTLRSVLKPSTDEPGALTLVAQVRRQAVTGLFTSDNRAFRSTGPNELLAVADFNSFTEFGERSEVSIYHTYNDTETFGQGSVETYVGGSGLKVKAYFGDGETTPSDLLREAGYDGITRVFGLQASYPIIRTREETLNVTANFDAVESDILAKQGNSGAEVRNSFDSLRVLRIGADYAREDLLLGGDRTGTNSASVKFSQGLPGLGASGGHETDLPREGEIIGFHKLDAELDRTQTLLVFSDTSNLALVGVLAGQVTNEILPPEEKFYLGGPRFNRGFYSGEATGDSALVASIELDYSTSLPFPIAKVPYTDIGADLNATFYTFFDWGQTWDNDPQVVRADHSLRSVGLGTRLYFTRYTEFDLEGVRRLQTKPDGSGQNVSAVKGYGLYWRVLARF